MVFQDAGQVVAWQAVADRIRSEGFRLRIKPVKPALIGPNPHNTPAIFVNGPDVFIIYVAWGKGEAKGIMPKFSCFRIQTIYPSSKRGYPNGSGAAHGDGTDIMII